MPAYGKRALQSSSPVRISNARIRLSIEAAMKTRPPAVVIGPPMIDVPHSRNRGNVMP